MISNAISSLSFFTISYLIEIPFAAFYGQCTRRVRQGFCVVQVLLLSLPGLEFEARWRGANKWSIYQPAIRVYPSCVLILRAVITNQYYTAFACVVLCEMSINVFCNTKRNLYCSAFARIRLCNLLESFEIIGCNRCKTIYCLKNLHSR